MMILRPSIQIFRWAWVMPFNFSQKKLREKFRSFLYQHNLIKTWPTKNKNSFGISLIVFSIPAFLQPMSMVMFYSITVSLMVFVRPFSWMGAEAVLITISPAPTNPLLFRILETSIGKASCRERV